MDAFLPVCTNAVSDKFENAETLNKLTVVAGDGDKEDVLLEDLHFRPIGGYDLGFIKGKRWR